MPLERVLKVSRNLLCSDASMILTPARSPPTVAGVKRRSFVFLWCGVIILRLVTLAAQEVWTVRGWTLFNRCVIWLIVSVVFGLFPLSYHAASLFYPSPNEAAGLEQLLRDGLLFVFTFTI